MMIEENICKLGGNLKFSIETFTDSHRILYVLIQNKVEPVIVVGILLQYKQTKEDTILYVEALDTTGYFNPRNKQSVFTKEFVKSVLFEQKSNFICTFSHPKDQLLFGRSVENTVKGSLSARKLLYYWIDIFKCIPGAKIDVVSNFYRKNTYPSVYKSLHNLHIFKDDPKRKLIEETDGSITVKELFNMLVFRKDFIKGSLIYCTSINTTKDNTVKLNEKRQYCDIDSLLKFLRSSDFSNLESAKKATENFYHIHECQNHWFLTNNAEIEVVVKKEIPIITITPRKK